MTEAEWLASNDPQVMLEFITRRSLISARKLRLFAVAVYRSIRPHNVEHEQTAWRWETHEYDLSSSLKSWLSYVVQSETDSGHNYPSPGTVAALLRDVVGNPFRPPQPLYRLAKLDDSGWSGLHKVPDSPWLTHNDGAVAKLAKVIYDERKFDALPMLADALQEAGCDDEAILRHCRGMDRHPRCGVQSHDLECEACGVRLYGQDVQAVCRFKQGPHVRGCWVLDLLLGKE